MVKPHLGHNPVKTNFLRLQQFNDSAETQNELHEHEYVGTTETEE